MGVLANIHPLPPTAPGAVTPTPTRALLRAIGNEFRGKAPEGLDSRAWADGLEQRLGTDHPDAVLREAFELLADRLRFWPSRAEIVDAVLAAYGKLGVPFSPSATTLARDRADADRYTGGSDGRRRFVPDLRLASLGYGEHLTGRDGNRLLDLLPAATVEDVEAAARAVASRARDGATAANVEAKWMREARIEALERTSPGARLLHWLPDLGEGMGGATLKIDDAECRGANFLSLTGLDYPEDALRRHLDETQPRDIGGEALMQVIELWARPIMQPYIDDPLLWRFNWDGQRNIPKPRWWDEKEPYHMIAKKARNRRELFYYFCEQFEREVAGRTLRGAEFVEALEAFLNLDK